MALGRTAARVGQAYPFAPPVGLMYVIWGQRRRPRGVAAARSRTAGGPRRELLGRVVDDCREVGYLVERLTPVGRKLFSLMAGVAGRDLPTELRELIGEMVSSLGERVYLHSETELDIDYR